MKKITLPNGKKKYIYASSPREVTQKEREMMKEYDSGIILGDETTAGHWSQEWFSIYKFKAKIA